jgi:energy-coupling factor transport system permease protein
MREFKNFHPIINFIYFVLVIGFSMFFMHPLALIISFSSAFLSLIMIKGIKAIKQTLLFMLPMIILTTLINPLLNHQGVTILAYLPSGNPLTLESMLYGLCAAIMIINVIFWFAFYNEVMTSDKFIYLFGKIIPSMSLILSMTLKFVPTFISQMKTVSNARRCMGKNPPEKNIIKKAKNAITVLSSVTTWSLENAIETADSMKARGYGTCKRSAFSIFKFDKRDLTALIFMLITGAYTFIGSVFGTMKFSYFPAIKYEAFSVYNIIGFISYLLLCIYPALIELMEVKKWNSLKSKI